MRPVLVKAYGWLRPATPACAEALEEALASWFIHDAVELEGDLLRLAHEGEYFPADEALDALTPFLTPQSEGKLDVLDLEAWTLTRHTWPGGKAQSRSSSLNQALEKSCGRA